MEKIDRYRKYIREVIACHSSPSAYSETEVQQIFDIERDHYQLVHTGWFELECLYGCIAHLDIKDGRIWIQYECELGVESRSQHQHCGDQFSVDVNKKALR